MINNVKLRLAHTNMIVKDIDRSLKFYKEHFDIEPAYATQFKPYELRYLMDQHRTNFMLELTCNKEETELSPWRDGAFGIHVAFVTSDFDGWLKRHESAGIVTSKMSEQQGYFVNDPDGYSIEVLSDAADRFFKGPKNATRSYHRALEVDHINRIVKDIDATIAFYQENLNMAIFKGVELFTKYRFGYLCDTAGGKQLLELTQNTVEKELNADPSDGFGSHMAFSVSDAEFEAAYQLHKGKNLIVRDIHDKGVYFIADPDGYWIEIIADRLTNDLKAGVRY